MAAAGKRPVRAASTSAHWTNLARIAERGTFDSIFLADGPALWGHARYRPGGALEPTVLLTALAGVTSRIGLIATASTTYNEPVQPGSPVRLAGPHQRRAGRLEHRHHGRARRPRRTSGSTTTRPTRERYRRAAEFIDVSIRLWDSWEDGAEIGDKAAGVYADDSRIHEIDYQGEFFRVRGPLNVPRSPAGPPAAGPGGLVARRPGVRGPVRRGGVHRPADARRRAGVLRRPEGPRPPARPRPGPGQDLARPGAGHRLDRGRGPGAGGRTRGADRPRVRPGPAGQGARGDRRSGWNWTAGCPRRCTPRPRSKARRAASS